MKTNNLDLQRFTMREYLDTAKACIDTPKQENTNSCYGMSALVLLTSVINTIGLFYWEKQNKGGDGKVSEHFGEFYNKFLVGTLNDVADFKKYFYEFARCCAVHGSNLHKKTKITFGTEAPLFIKEASDKYCINLSELYLKVEGAYDTWCQDAYPTSNVQSLSQEKPSPLTSSTKNFISHG